MSDATRSCDVISGARSPLVVSCMKLRIERACASDMPPGGGVLVPGAITSGSRTWEITQCGSLRIRVSSSTVATPPAR